MRALVNSLLVASALTAPAFAQEQPPGEQGRRRPADDRAATAVEEIVVTGARIVATGVGDEPRSK